MKSNGIHSDHETIELLIRFSGNFRKLSLRFECFEFLFLIFHQQCSLEFAWWHSFKKMQTTIQARFEFWLGICQSFCRCGWLRDGVISIFPCSEGLTSRCYAFTLTVDFRKYLFHIEYSEKLGKIHVLVL